MDRIGIKISVRPYSLLMPVYIKYCTESQTICIIKTNFFYFHFYWHVPPPHIPLKIIENIHLLKNFSILPEILPPFRFLGGILLL